MNSEEEDKSEVPSGEDVATAKSTLFKKPLLIGKVGRLPRKITKKDDTKEENVSPLSKEENVCITEVTSNTNGTDSLTSFSELPDTITTEEGVEKNIPLPYKEPPWSGLPQSETKDYEFQVLKSGIIIETINLMKRPFWVFGRFTSCDICLAHPTVSRYHAILQYRNQAQEDRPCGFYLCDLASTHGTFLNKNRLKSRVYARVQVGHMIKFGCSTRTFLLTGPNEDMEEESEFTVNELKQQRAEELLKREEMENDFKQRIKEEEERKQKLFEERGVDWGISEDADEETDLAENPFAEANNEELYIDDPKKALRGFMEREGHDLEYDCTEQGMGQFLCKVELPIDDERGRPIVAEVLHKGKKKEAVIQCALEACRILDRYGLLRQATHESRKRKVKNWEENDFYDSDDDTFLDRTGIIEKKRENRMKAKIPQQPETYQSLTEKQKKLNEEISMIEKLLCDSGKKLTTSSTSEEDTLDSYMKELKQSKLDKQSVNKLKTDLHKLKQEYGSITKLINIVKPTDLPPLIEEKSQEHSNVNVKHKLPLYGKRLKVKVQVPLRSQNENLTDMDVDDENDDDVNKDKVIVEKKNETSMTICPQKKEEKNNISSKNVDKDVQINSQKCIMRKQATNVLKSNANMEDKYFSNCNRIDASFRKLFNFMTTVHESQILEIWNNLKTLNQNSSSDRNQSILNLFLNYIDGIGVVIKEKVSKDIDEIKTAINNACSNETIIEVGDKLINVVREITYLINKLDKVGERQEEPPNKDEEPPNKDEELLELEKRRKKNQRRLQQRQEKTEKEKQKGYEEDALKEDYNMWVPPEGQTGDGRTCLNDKLGY